MADGRFFPPPQPGDIVWCRMPDEIGAPPSKARPALVIATGEIEGEAAARVAYGTSQKVDRLHSGEFAIRQNDGDAYLAAGLSVPTKFNLKRSVELPYNDVWFAVAPGAPFGQTPKLGLLHPMLMRRAHAASRAAEN